MWIHLPTLKKSEDSAEDIPEENVEASGGINSIKLTGVRSIGDGPSICHLFQDKIAEIHQIMANQGVSVGSTLNVSLCALISISISLSNIFANLALRTSLSYRSR